MIALLLSISTMTFATLGLAIKTCLKSNCTEVKCCGVHCKREHTDVAAELDV